MTEEELRAQLLASIARCVGEDPAEADPAEVDDLMQHVLPVVRRYAAAQLREAAGGARIVHPDQGWCVSVHTLADRAVALEDGQR